MKRLFFIIALIGFGLVASAQENYPFGLIEDQSITLTDSMAYITVTNQWSIAAFTADTNIVVDLEVRSEMRTGALLFLAITASGGDRNINFGTGMTGNNDVVPSGLTYYYTFLYNDASYISLGGSAGGSQYVQWLNNYGYYSSNDTIFLADSLQTVLWSTIYVTSITGTDGEFTDLDILNDFYAVSATITDLTTTNGYFTSITSTDGEFTDLDILNDLYAVSATITDETVTNAYFTSVTSTDGEFTDLDVLNDFYAVSATITDLTSTNGYFTSVTGTDGEFTDLDILNDFYAVSATLTTVVGTALDYTYAELDSLNAGVIYVDSLFGIYITAVNTDLSGDLYAVSATVDDGTITNILGTALDYTYAELDSLNAGVVYIDSIFGVYITAVNFDLSGDLYAVSITATDLTATNFYVTSVTSVDGEYTDLDVLNDFYAVSATITTLVGTALDYDYANIDSLVTLVGYIDSIFSDYGLFVNLDVTNDFYAVSATTTSLQGTDAIFSNVTVTGAIGASGNCVPIIYATTVTGCSLLPVELEGGATAFGVTVTDLNGLWIGDQSTGYSVPNAIGNPGESQKLDGTGVLYWDADSIYDAKSASWIVDQDTIQEDTVLYFVTWSNESIGGAQTIATMSNTQTLPYATTVTYTSLTDGVTIQDDSIIVISAHASGLWVVNIQATLSTNGPNGAEAKMMLMLNDAVFPSISQKTFMMQRVGTVDSTQNVGATGIILLNGGDQLEVEFQTPGEATGTNIVIDHFNWSMYRIDD
jgi:glucokinase